jgi:hypothetical protein
MASVPKKSRRTSNQYRLAQTGIPDYANQTLEDQVALFSKLVMRNSKMPIYRVWSKIDPVAHYVIMSELECFDGKDAPQLSRARRDQRNREVVAVLENHIRLLQRFHKMQEEHDSRTARFGVRSIRKYTLAPGVEGPLRSVLETELGHLKQLVGAHKRRLKQASKWDVKRMIIAQEYVIRRVYFLGLPKRVRLTPDAIADIYQLTRAAADRSDVSDTAENIRKAIAYFRKNPKNAHFLQKIEDYLKDWTEPVSKGKPGN